ncbi:hypothetical protein [Bradyrhizobium japonicum]|uniref:hypothetical protein n=1 Tax=Bradyrhizobium japonicum TaxID=375 RepID=UPI0012BC94ED|nr:hypothetical protein [Bradyrhizobium japonicum]
MLKHLAVIVAVAVFGAAACAVEAWLERRNMDKAEAAFLAGFTIALIALAGLLIVHFGRWV